MKFLNARPGSLLSENEKLLNEWNYASAKTGFFDETFYTLTLTSKRIIVYSVSDHTRNSKEIPLNSITSVNASVHKKRPWRLIITLFLLSIVAIFFMHNPLEDPAGLIFYAVSVIAAIVLIFLFGVKVNLNVEIKTSLNENTDEISISAGAMIQAKRKIRLKFEADPIIAEDILNTLGLFLTNTDN